MKICLDVDGVIANTIQLMLNIMNEKGIELEFNQYNPVIKGVADSKKFIKEVVGDMFDNRIMKVQPYISSIKTLPYIYKNLGSITFLTARREEFKDKTLKWLKTHCDIPFDLVHKSSSEKPQFILDNGYDVFVEDRLRTANQAAEAGIKTYLINRQWNEGRPTHKNVVRVGSLIEFYLKEKK